MISLRDYINENIDINEAKRIDLNSASNEELLNYYWRHWAGWESNGRKTGLSSNPTAVKISNAIYDKFADCDYSANPANKLLKLDDYLKSKLGISEFDMYNYNDSKVPKMMEELIKKNSDWLFNCEIDKNYEIKD